MITLNWLDVGLLIVAVVSLVWNILQYQKLSQIEKQRFTPIYNGLVGLFNDAKNKSLHCYTRQSFLLAPNNPYKSIESLKGNFYEFTIETAKDFNGLVEHIVPILKTIDPTDKGVFKGIDFAVTEKEEEAREQARRRLRTQEEIQQRKLDKQLGQLKRKESKEKS